MLCAVGLRQGRSSIYLKIFSPIWGDWSTLLLISMGVMMPLLCKLASFFFSGSTRANEMLHLSSLTAADGGGSISNFSLLSRWQSPRNISFYSIRMLDRAHSDYSPPSLILRICWWGTAITSMACITLLHSSEYTLVCQLLKLQVIMFLISWVSYQHYLHLPSGLKMVLLYITSTWSHFSSLVLLLIGVTVITLQLDLQSIWNQTCRDLVA